MIESMYSTFCLLVSAVVLFCVIKYRIHVHITGSWEGEPRRSVNLRSRTGDDPSRQFPGSSPITGEPGRRARVSAIARPSIPSSPFYPDLVSALVNQGSLSLIHI